MSTTPETPMQAACRLAAGALRKGYKFEALHAYTDRAGNPDYWRIRAKHPATGKKMDSAHEAQWQRVRIARARETR